MLRETLVRAAEAIDAARLYVVTAALTPGLADRLLQLRSGRRDIAVVWVDSPSFAGNPSIPGAQAAALRLARAGVPVARLGNGDDLRRALSAATARTAVHA